MPFLASSGLSGLLTDGREFLATVRLARPGALWLLLLIPLLAVLDRYAAHRRRQALATIGRPAALANQFTHPRPRYRWLGLAYPLAWLLLVAGVAGPRWGKSDEPGVAVGRDVVVVIDLSRSMLADDVTESRAKARWEAARDGALDLLGAMARRGGHRVGVVVFAARPKLVCPLTTDYKHARAVLEAIDGQFPPPECRPGADPGATSGTRFGAALVAAVEAHDPRFVGSQDIVLVSDGDDPEESDREWVKGANAARAAAIPVHTVGVGNPGKATVPDLGPDAIEVFSTKLEEGEDKPLRLIAGETQGQYVAARTGTPRLGAFFLDQIEGQKVRTVVGDDQVPQLKDRYPWFVAPALALFLVGWLRGR